MPSRVPPSLAERIRLSEYAVVPLRIGREHVVVAADARIVAAPGGGDASILWLLDRGGLRAFGPTGERRIPSELLRPALAQFFGLVEDESPERSPADA